MTDAASLGDALGKASQDLDDLLLRARQRFQENEGQFASEGIGILCGGLEIYGALFKQSGYEDRESLENAIGQQCLEVTKAAEKLLDVEEELSAAGCQVVVVTFGDVVGAERWLLETNCPFPYFTNPSRALYKALGLRRSIDLVWNAASLSYYGGKLAKNEPLPQAYADIKDDPHQMGGDFILDKEGRLLFAYRSKTPSDRPSVDLIIKALIGTKVNN
ncbi:uncharacterized protein LOC135199463 isoform X3 [Macrobrachium nipponense]|uniref:uncharacterized protein LOC135199463 isoform X3 n=1 Tax=Macrobrachium nipponense TaxID=159736 RepID=UPI0030C7BD8F